MSCDIPSNYNLQAGGAPIFVRNNPAGFPRPPGTAESPENQTACLGGELGRAFDGIFLPSDGLHTVRKAGCREVPSSAPLHRWQYFGSGLQVLRRRHGARELNLVRRHASSLAFHLKNKSMAISPTVCFVLCLLHILQPDDLPGNSGAPRGSGRSAVCVASQAEQTDLAPPPPRRTRKRYCKH